MKNYRYLFKKIGEGAQYFKKGTRNKGKTTRKKKGRTVRVEPMLTWGGGREALTHSPRVFRVLVSQAL